MLDKSYWQEYLNVEIAKVLSDVDQFDGPYIYKDHDNVPYTALAHGVEKPESEAVSGFYLCDPKEYIDFVVKQIRNWIGTANQITWRQRPYIQEENHRIKIYCRLTKKWRDK